MGVVVSVRLLGEYPATVKEFATRDEADAWIRRNMVVQIYHIIETNKEDERDGE